MAASRRQVRHRDQPLLLGRRDPGDGVRRHLHDAVLLRLARALGARVPASCASTRRRARFNAIIVRGDDGVLVRASRCTRMGKLLQPAARLELHTSACCVSAAIVLAYIFLGGLTSAIYNEVLQFFLIVARLPAAGAPRAEGRRRLGGAAGDAARPRRAGVHADAWIESWQHWRRHQPDGRRVVRPGDGPRLRAVVRLLVHRLPRRAAGDGGRLDDRRAPHAADRRASRRCSSRSW